MITQTDRFCLAVNIGNTSTAVGCFPPRVDKQRVEINKQVEIFAKWRFPTHPVGNIEAFQIQVKEALASIQASYNNIETVLISSVVPSQTPIVAEAFRSLPTNLGTRPGPQPNIRHKIKIEIIDFTWPFSFELGTQHPGQIGIDRLVCAEAAVRQFGVPVLVVDFGTATTFTTVIMRERPVYIGGAIMPGLEMGMRALSQRTALLPMIDLDSPELALPLRAIGRNTKEALQSGVILGHACMVEGMIQRFRDELNLQNLKIVATGGNGKQMKNICNTIYEQKWREKSISGAASLATSLATSGAASLAASGATTAAVECRAPSAIHEYNPELALEGIGYLYETISQR